MLYKTKILKNGLSVIHVPLKMDNRLFIQAVFKVGSIDGEEFPSGMAHFLEHMIFRGTKTHPSFKSLALLFEQLGGELNAETSYEYTLFSFYTVKKNLKKALELFGEFLTEPIFCDIELEKKVVISEIDDEHNEYNHCTDIFYHGYKNLYPGHGLAKSILGTVDSVKSITPENLKSFYKKYFISDKMALVLAGDFDFKQLDLSGFEKIRSHASKLENQNSVKPGPKSTFEFLLNADRSYDFLLSFGLPYHEFSPEVLGLELISNILSDGFSSKLCARLREDLGLVYSIESDLTLGSFFGTFDIVSSVSNRNLPVFLDELKKILSNLVQDGPSLEELKRSKNRLLVTHEFQNKNISSFCFNLGWYLLNDKTYDPSKMLLDIKKWTPKKIKELAAKCFKDSPSALVLMGPEEIKI